uniref:Uncharacterized protein n=1 Tax=Oryza nivara TaxID=4536 RepID=A0A0E0HC01_ORYNI
MPAAGAHVPVAAGASSAASAGVVGNHRWELRHSGGAVQRRRAPRVPRRRGGALEHRRRAHWPGRCSTHPPVCRQLPPPLQPKPPWRHDGARGRPLQTTQAASQGVTL